MSVPSEAELDDRPPGVGLEERYALGIILKLNDDRQIELPQGLKGRS